MFRLAFDESRGVLLVTFAGEYNESNLLKLHEALRRFIDARGAPHIIVDFSGADSSDIPLTLIKARRNIPTLVPGKRRVFIADQDGMFGLLRVYCAYQPDPQPLVVRTMNDALKALSIEQPAFESVLL